MTKKLGFARFFILFFVCSFYLMEFVCYCGSCCSLFSTHLGYKNCSSCSMGAAMGKLNYSLPLLLLPTEKDYYYHFVCWHYYHFRKMSINRCCCYWIQLFGNEKNQMGNKLKKGLKLVFYTRFIFHLVTRRIYSDFMNGGLLLFLGRSMKGNGFSGVLY